MLKGLTLGILLGVLLVTSSVYYYFSSGHAPVATAARPMPFEKTLAKIGLHAYLAKLPHPDPQVPSDETNLISGARVYRQHCAVCHGGPGAATTAIANGMFPKPPELLHGKGVTNDEAWESYWKVENGIRMSGMPGFKDHLTETQIWQVAVLVKNADKIPPAVRNELVVAAAAPVSVAAE
jgi:mono/diheme cytochrome c family protein